MNTNSGRGITRVWVVFVGLIELAIVGLAVLEIVHWYSENPFDQFDAGYISLWHRLFRFLVAIGVIPIIAYTIWRAVRWISQGFSE